MVFYLIYISKSAELMSEQQLKEILTQSRVRNTRLNITGLLLYVEGKFLDVTKHQVPRKMSGRFIQVLEGNESDVRALYDLIQRDPKHTNHIVLKEEMIPGRNFGEWAMGCCAASIEQQHAGFADLENVFLESGGEEICNRPLAFLASFYQMSKMKL
ncbi:BLUF domain-containing protein [Pedobacter sp. MR2016-24]|uniref:BLUF domain-containing protein n=1 Tax=Pedobacter sp. MR2016-24 TaxID=2994466 RepID=UPI0022452A0F|nr:BLUF domain-containing protein [Pedobacter sp. MR2016-24]MCX2485036.1 BLUF domain-containing protein [Pedobacter sp. MR2016-24]